MELLGPGLRLPFGFQIIAELLKFSGFSPDNTTVWARSP